MIKFLTGLFMGGTLGVIIMALFTVDKINNNGVDSYKEE